MALQRRGRNLGHATIWPGFVDAMTGLLLVLMFVLTIFTVMQFVLRDEISGQETELTNLTGQVAALAAALGLERDRSSSLTADLTRASDEATQQSSVIAALTAERDAQTRALSDASTRITAFEAEVAGLLAARRADAATIAGLEQERSEQAAAIADLESDQARLMTEQEALNLALATARDEISAGAEEARLAAARREALEALVTTLQNDTAARGETITDLEAARLVDAAAAQALRDRLRDADAELTAMTLSLEAERAEAENTLTLLAAARAAQDDLNIRLATALLAQQAAEDGLAQAETEGSAIYARLVAALTLQETTSAELAAAEERLAQTTADRDALNTQLAAALAAQDLAAGDLAAARATLAEVMAEADLSQSEIEERLTQAVLAQSALRAELTAREATAAEATAALEAQLAAALAAQTAMQDDLRATEAEQADLQSRLAEALLRQQELEARATSADQSESDLQASLAAALAQVTEARAEAADQMTAAERQAALLASANAALSQEQALSAESQRQVALLNEQVAALRNQVGTLQSLLDVAADDDVEAQVQIEALGSQLNTALARVAAEERRRAALEETERLRLEAETARLAAEAQNLEQYRSEFFGRLREVLAGQEGVRIEGDRFVFSSEVLFDAGRAELSPEGQTEIAQVAALLRTISGEIPPSIDWIIRVDGHTDNIPLSGTGEFADNWELSQARALSVVRYMTANEGIPPNRLAANGFGEYQPLSTEDSDAARAQNRRIELKLTER